ncbi:uncharacterized protein LOC116941623 [Petromyzon marinus]|uniref:uncharacterized protein LOC116941623 n=1 Tax=Petromyzon marinus TaxID=7757 RepID=UPI003F6FE1A8
MVIRRTRLDRLRARLDARGLSDVAYALLSEHGPHSRSSARRLARRLPSSASSSSSAVTAHAQASSGPDLWTLLGGQRNDILVYDRCGRLTVRLSLPYSFLDFPYVESAIVATHTKEVCGACPTSSEAPGSADTATAAPADVAKVRPGDGGGDGGGGGGGEGRPASVDYDCRDDDDDDDDDKKIEAHGEEDAETRGKIDALRRQLKKSEPPPNHHHHHHGHGHGHHHGHGGAGSGSR